MENLKVLIVDDNVQILKMISRKLEKKGFNVTIAESGQQALSMLNDKTMDLVLIDHMMPNMTGIETLIKLTDKFNEKKEIAPPVIMLTAHGNLHVAVEFMKAGGDDFMQKPIDFEILMIKIKKVLENRENQKMIAEEKAARMAAENTNLLKSKFLANMSHEIRTPMHGISSFAQLGIKKAKKIGQDTLLDYFQEIYSCEERLILLLNDLLDLSNLESGKTDYDLRMADLSNLTLVVKNEFMIRAAEKEITLEFERPDFQTKIIIDQNRIVQVIQNLLSNSIKYSLKGGSVQIQIKKTENNELTFLVIDRGIGIPEKELIKIFEKFEQSSITKTGAGGTGLGLAISKKIITAHNGKIWAINNPDKGATFGFMLPFK